MLAINTFAKHIFRKPDQKGHSAILIAKKNWATRATPNFAIISEPHATDFTQWWTHVLSFFTAIFMEGPHFSQVQQLIGSSSYQSIKVDLQPRGFAAADLFHLRRTQSTQRQILPGRRFFFRVAGCGSALFQTFWSSHTYSKMIECIEKKGGGVVSANFSAFLTCHFCKRYQTLFFPKPNIVASVTNKSNHCAFSTALPMSYIDT